VRAQLSEQERRTPRFAHRLLRHGQDYTVNESFRL
jgi:Holliday junction resolvasome RuvABC ATP-dependent DNA helicase subunit